MMKDLDKKYGENVGEQGRLFFTSWVPLQEHIKKLVDQSIHIMETRRKQKEKEFRQQ